MGKRILNIYVEDGDVSLAKAQGLNISRFLREALSLKVGGIKDNVNKSKNEIITELESKIATLSVELSTKIDECKKLQKERIELKLKLEQNEKKNENKRTFIDLSNPEY